MRIPDSVLNLFIFLIRWSVNFTLVYLISYSVMQLWLLLDSEDFATNSPPQFINQTQLYFATADNMSALLKAHLFGESSHVEAAVLKKKVQAPVETKLNLKLQGVFYSTESQKSYAMITGSNGKSLTYKENEYLSKVGVGGDVVLHNIYPKKVILQRNGRYETLLLIGTQKKQSLIKQLKNSDAINSVATKKLLATYQKQLQTNPRNIMKLIRINPENQNGRFVGFRIEPGQDASLLSHFNLKSGDVLTAVNGIRLDSPIKGLAVVQQLATAKQINMELLRQGRTVSLSFAVEK